MGLEIFACTPGVTTSNEFWSKEILNSAGVHAPLTVEVVWRGQELRDLCMTIRQVRIEAGDSDIVVIVPVRNSRVVTDLRSVYTNAVWQIDLAGQNWSSPGWRTFGDVAVDPAMEPGSPVVRRFLSLVLGPSTGGPTSTEQAMYFAAVAALRSDAIRGHVGAAICDAEGEVLAVGANEVPKAGGGQYWVDDSRDGRDRARFGFDFATSERNRDFEDVLEWLIEVGELPEERLAAIRAEVQQRLRSARLPRVLHGKARGRAVHAEEAALLSAARRGVSVRDSQLFTTQLPCHVCLRHLVAAGISRICYLRGSETHELDYRHGDAVTLGESDTNSRVPLITFTGIAPRGYTRLFGKTPDEQRTDEGFWKIFEEAICGQPHDIM